MPGVLLVTTALYVGLLAAAAAFAHRAAAAPPTPTSVGLPFVSVLVAARDEEALLPRCLAALRAQDYPSDHFEVIVADDGSVDGSAAIAASFARDDDRFRHLAVDPDRGASHLRGKARAVHQAAEAARGDLLVTTDADCTPPPGWLRALASQFDDPDVGVVSGATVVAHRTALDRVQALDWLLLLTAAAGAARAGRPITAQGNNMAFRRAAYDAVGGFPGLPFSVTEDYAFFRAVHTSTPWHVRLLLDPRVANRTEPLPTLRAVFGQRRRWARGGLRTEPWVYGVYTVVLAVHVLLPVGLVLHPWATLPLLLAKGGADLLALHVGRRRTGQRGLLRSFPTFELYYFAYVVAMPLALLLRPRVRWKGRDL